MSDRSTKITEELPILGEWSDTYETVWPDCGSIKSVYKKTAEELANIVKENRGRDYCVSCNTELIKIINDMTVCPHCEKE